MYTRLTKVVTDEDGNSYVACVNYGTERCRIHNGAPDCIRCPVLGAMLNQLHAFEEMIIECQNVPDDNVK